MPEQTAKRVSPAYVSYNNFRGFLARLKETVVPSVIDYSAMGDKLANGTKGHLRASLRFLGLIDADGATQPALRALVEAHGTDAWPAAINKHLLVAYDDILRDFDLGQGTPQQLRSRFDAATGGNEDTSRKAIAFFLQAAHEAKRAISKLIAVPNADGDAVVQERTRKPGRTGRSRSRPSAGDVDGNGRVPPEKPGQTLHKFQIRPGVFVQIGLPDDITTAEVKRIATWLQTLPLPDKA